MALAFTFICLMITQLLLTIQKKPLDNSYAELEEQFFSAQKAQKQLDERLEEFFTAHKAHQEQLDTRLEEMKMLVTDLAVTMARHRGAPIPSQDKDERSNRLKALIHERFKANVAESIFMG